MRHGVLREHWFQLVHDDGVSGDSTRMELGETQTAENGETTVCDAFAGTRRLENVQVTLYYYSRTDAKTT